MLPSFIRSRWLHALNVKLPRRISLLLSVWRNMQLRGAALLFAAVEDSAAARGGAAYCRCRGLCRCNGADTPKPLLPDPSSLPFLLWCDFLLSWPHHPSLVSTIPLPPSKFYSQIHKLILLMLGQCTNPGSPYPYPVCLRPYIKTNIHTKCYKCRSWVHQKCSGLANATIQMPGFVPDNRPLLLKRISPAPCNHHPT